MEFEITLTKLDLTWLEFKEKLELNELNFLLDWFHSDKQAFVNFINNLRAAFAPISFRQKIVNVNVSTEKLLKTLSYKKNAPKMLVKLTPYRTVLQARRARASH